MFALTFNLFHLSILGHLCNAVPGGGGWLGVEGFFLLQHMLSSLSSGEGHEFRRLPAGVFRAPVCNREDAGRLAGALQGRAM